MEIIPKPIEDYLLANIPEELPVLKKINRDTYAEVLMPRMLSGHYQGRLLSMFSKMIRPENILEIGTFTGYSAICLAEGLQESGKLYTIDINEELEARVRGYFKEAGLDNKIEYLIGNALEIIPSLNINFDLVFVDADKANYSNYFDLVINKVKKGGIIIADNVLWSGKVIQEGKLDKDTEKILNFNKKIQDHPEVENLILPVRDGLMVMRKL
ncbi:MAG TPA: O-methyltransferase [Cytophagales bacterium]|nr:O-methyltransferase [Cytophagales bacterium]